MQEKFSILPLITSLYCKESLFGVYFAFHYSNLNTPIQIKKKRQKYYKQIMLVFIKKKNEKGINSLCSDIKENHHFPLNAPLFCYITLQRGAPLSHNIKRPQDTKKLHACKCPTSLSTKG